MIVANTVGGASGIGGGVNCLDYSTPTLTNCTIVANTATGALGYGGGVACQEDSNPTLTNCTITANVADDNGGALYCTSNVGSTLTNCILWADSPQEIVKVGSGTLVVDYCDVEGGWGGTGNIDSDPLFVRDPDPGLDGQWDGVDDDYGNLHLRSDSPCIDEGTNGAVTTPTDLDGNRRIADGDGDSTAVVDMGAYEYQWTVIPAVSEWGLMIMALLVLAAGVVLVRSRKRAMA